MGRGAEIGVAAHRCAGLVGGRRRPSRPTPVRTVLIRDRATGPILA